MVKAKDAAGNSSLGGSVEVTPIDNIPPSAPKNVAVTSISSLECTLSWTASTDNIGVVVYEIFISGDSIGNTETTSFKVTGLSPSTLYQITVKAKDAAGNSSMKSAVVVTTKAAGINSVGSYPDFTIYPNPARDYVLIDVPESLSGSVFIYNASGILVAEIAIQSNPFSIDVSAFPKGFYLAKINIDQKCITRTFIIQ